MDWDYLPHNSISYRRKIYKYYDIIHTEMSRAFAWRRVTQEKLNQTNTSTDHGLYGIASEFPLAVKVFFLVEMLD